MSISFFFKFLNSQLLTSIPYPTSDFTGQTIIVTGSNTGLGKEAARHIARLGAAKVILAVRTISKGEAAAAEIVGSTNVAPSVLEVWHLDMADIGSIKAFAKRAESLPRLDAAILNAGILMNQFKETQGVESTVAVNVIGTNLLALLLLPTLRTSAKSTGLRGRLSIVGSDTLYVADKNELETSGAILEKLNDKERSAKGMGGRYPLSKLLQCYSVHELGRRSPLSKESNVLINNLTPGMCYSEILRDDASLAFRALEFVMKILVARPTEVGARTLVYGAVPELPANTHGEFLMDNKVVEFSDLGDGVATEAGQRLAKKFNRELYEYLERIAPGSTAI